ncbi:MAG: leucine-rich repeat domain-containing protein [Ruminococcaceae bacterium]|nr:leucine-rich repeat domain-containing protein [Oscillospiraceae bacterium]
MKKYLAMALAALLLVCSMASCTNGLGGSIDEYAPEVDYLITDTGTFYFEEGDGETAILVKYVGKATSDDRVVIPATFGDRTVTAIGDEAFYNLAAIVEVTIPDTILDIGEYAFARCTELTEIVLPDSVLEIAEGAFIECTSLTKVTMSANILTIGEKAFYGCSALADIQLPEGLDVIGKGAFTSCRSLPALTVPASVTSIGEMAYTDCTGIEKITFGSGFTKIEAHAFEHADGTNLKDKFDLTGLADDCAVAVYVNALSDSPETEPVTEAVTDDE